MIDAAPPAAVVAPAPIVAAPRFAPPVGQTFRYRVIDTRPIPEGTARIALDQTVRVTAAAGGAREIAVVATAETIEAPARIRAALTAMFAPFRMQPMRATLHADGSLGPVIGLAETWAAIVASMAAAEPLAAAHARLAATPPAEQADTIRAAIATLLPPPLPPLRPGERRAFSVDGGGDGTVTLRFALPDRLVYLIERDGRRGDRAYVERSELTIARDSGLLLAARTATHAVSAAGQGPPLDRSEIALLP